MTNTREMRFVKHLRDISDVFDLFCFSKAYLLTFLLINKVIALDIDSKQFKMNRYWRFNSKKIVKILNCFLLLILLDDLSYFLNIKKRNQSSLHFFSVNLGLFFFPKASKISELLEILNNYF